MKTTLLSFALLLAGTSFAQKIELKKGQTIKVTTVTTQNTEMSMGMSLKGVATTYNTVNVTDEGKDSYTVTNTLSRMVVNNEMMGQQINYDSDKPEDRTSDMGKGLEKVIGKSNKVLITKSTGLTTSLDPEKQPEADDKNPMSAMMGAIGAGNDAATVANVLFVIPANKKVGDTWTDSSTTEGIKTINQYTYTSQDKNMVTISSNTIVAGITTMEAQGTSVNINMNTVAQGKILVDKNTSLVKSRNTNGTINSTIDVMGQTMDVTGTATTTTTYQ